MDASDCFTIVINNHTQITESRGARIETDSLQLNSSGEVIAEGCLIFMEDELSLIIEEDAVMSQHREPSAVGQCDSQPEESKSMDAIGVTALRQEPD